MFTSEVNKRHIGYVRVSVGSSCHASTDGKGFLGSMTDQYTAENVAFFPGNLGWDSFSVFLEHLQIASNLLFHIKQDRYLF